MKKSRLLGIVLLSFSAQCVFAGDQPFIQILEGVRASSPVINDLGEILYSSIENTLFSTERGLIASDSGGTGGIANNGEIVYGRRTQRDVFQLHGVF